MDRQQLSAIDFLSIMSFLLGVENLQENRQQSAHNDVSSANEKQAKFLLEKLSEKFDEQNEMLRQIMEVLKIEKPTGEE